MYHINTTNTSCKTSLISHATTWLIVYNQTSCLLTQHCPPHGHILEMNILIIIDGNDAEDGEATLCSRIDKTSKNSQTPSIWR